MTSLLNREGVQLILQNRMTSKAQKILGAISKLQFFVEWILSSQNSQGMDNFLSALAVIEGLKFYYRLQCLFNSPTIYIEGSEEPQNAEQAEDQQFPIHPQSVPATLEYTDKVLQSIKQKTYLEKHNVGVIEKTSSGKKIPLQSLLALSSRFKPKGLGYKELLGELLYIIRPLAYVIVLKICGTNNYKAWGTALVIDLIRWLIQAKMTVCSTDELDELSKRKGQMISKACFRSPFYSSIFKSKLVEPLLNRVMNSDRWLYRIIMYILEMKSSITLTI